MVSLLEKGRDEYSITFKRVGIALESTTAAIYCKWKGIGRSKFIVSRSTWTLHMLLGASSYLNGALRQEIIIAGIHWKRDGIEGGRREMAL